MLDTEKKIKPEKDSTMHRPAKLQTSKNIHTRGHFKIMTPDPNRALRKFCSERI